MKKRILILGGSFSYINSIQAAKEMGCEVIVADRNSSAPGFKYADVALPIDIVNVNACLSAAIEYKINGVVAVNDFGVMTASLIAHELGLPGLSVDVARISTSKYLMRKVWAEHKVPSVKYQKIHNVEELKTSTIDIGFPLIIKPCNSSGGGCRGIRYIDSNTDLVEAFRFANGFYNDNDILIEEFVTGSEHSVEVIIYQGKSYIITVSDNIKIPLPYRVNESILYPTILPDSAYTVLKKAVEDAIQAIGITNGIAHVELSMTDKGPVLFELGARCGGGAPAPLVPFLTGVEEFKEAVRLSLGVEPENLHPLRNDRGCAIKFFYPEPGIVRKISGVEKAQSLPGVLSFGLFIKEGDKIGNLRTCSDRAGMVITGAETREAALKLAEDVIKFVTIETYKED